MRKIGGLLAAFLAAAAITLAPPAEAHEGAGGSSPADGSILSVTPREVTFVLAESPSGGVNVEFVDADTGAVVPFAQGDARVDGRSVLFYPPSLEPGTYAVRYSYEASSGPRTGLFSFSVGAPSAVVVPVPDSSSPGPSLLLGLASALLGAAALAASIVLWTRRRARAVTGVLVGVSAVLAIAVLLLKGPVWAALPSLSVAALASGFGMRPRIGLVAAGLAAGFAGGFMLGFAGSIPWVSSALTGVGVACATALIGLSLAFAVSPGRALVFTKRFWGAFAVAGMLAPVAWVGSYLVREADLSPEWDAVSGVALSVAIATLALFVVAAFVVALLRRRARLSAVLAGVASLLMVCSLVTMVPLPFAPTDFERVELDASGTADSCLGTADRLSMTTCLQGLFAAKAQVDGVVPALDELGAATQASPQLRFFCHETAHAIGRSSLAFHEGNIAKAFSDGYDVCDFGYYHGIIEGAAGALSDDEFKAAVPGLCADLASANPLFFLQCTHGIGHAAARRANNDMVRGLEFCEFLDGSPDYADGVLKGALNACGTGVTMEWFAVAGANGGADGLAVSPAVDSLRDVCAVVSDRWLPECLEYVGNTLDTSRPKESLLEMASWCLTTKYPESCFTGLTRSAAGVALPVKDSIDVCSVAGPGRDACVLDYILTVSTTIDYSVSAVDRICAELPARDREGADSLCARAKRSAEEVLSAGDGKSVPSVSSEAS